MDISKDEINPNKRWCLCKKKGIVGIARGTGLKIKAGGGVQGEGAAPPPAMRTKREAHRHKSQWYIASKNEKIKKEAHRHKSRWISTKMKLTQINDDAYAKKKE